MYLPEGYTEEQVLADLDGALNSLAHSFRFGYFDEDDIRQEGFLIALGALPDFDPNHKSGCSLQSFLRTHLRRRFINLHRDKLHRNTPPCSNCHYFTEDGPTCEKFPDMNECPKWSGWQSRNQAKRSLMESCDVSKVIPVAHIDSEDAYDKLSRHELVQHISNNIPMALRADYRRFLDGARLSKKRREAVLEAIHALTGELTHGDFETW